MPDCRAPSAYGVPSRGNSTCNSNSRPLSLTLLPCPIPLHPPPTRYETGVWLDIPTPVSIRVFHFKWHAAVLRNLTDRLRFYKGSADSGGLPRYRHYHEAERVLAALEAGEQKLDTERFGCVPADEPPSGSVMMEALRRQRADARRRAAARAPEVEPEAAPRSEGA